jgi:hypothetical protein
MKYLKGFNIRIIPVKKDAKLTSTKRREKSRRDVEGD